MKSVEPSQTITRKEFFFYNDLIPLSDIFRPLKNDHLKKQST